MALRRWFWILLLLGGCQALSTATQQGCEPKPEEPPEQPALKFIDTSMALTNFRLLPDASIDVTAGPDTVDCEMTVTDGVSTVTSATCIIDRPGVSSLPCTALTPVGNVWTCPVVFPLDSAEGPYTVARVSAKNAAGVVAFADTADLQADTFPTSISVTTNAPDTTPPSISAYSNTLTTIDLTTDPNQIECLITAQDNKAVTSASCSYKNLADKQQHNKTVYTPFSGNTFKAIIPITATGTYDLLAVTAQDAVGNKRVLPKTEVAALPGPTQVQVVSGAGGGGGSSCTPTISETATSGWTSSAQQTNAATTLTMDYVARTTGTDALVAIGADPITTFSDAPMLVRFNTVDPDGAGPAIGSFDVCNGDCAGGNYSQDAVVPYIPNEWYSVRITADIEREDPPGVPDPRYSVDVGVCGQALQRIATNYVFRQGTDVSASGVDYYAAWGSSGVTIDVGDVVWTPGACTPLTCSSYPPNPATCGIYDDGCGNPTGVDCDTPNGGTCNTRQAGDVCNNGTCCTPSSTVCTDPNPDYVCGEWSDGCGGLVNCGSCTTGQQCNQTGQCVSSSQPTPANTGVTNEGLLGSWASKGYGSKTITSGGVYENFVDTGQFTIEASNVTFRNCRMSGGAYTVFVDGGASNFVMEDCEITGGSSRAGFITYGNATTLTRVHFQNSPTDAIKWIGDNGIIQNSLVEKYGVGKCGGTAHIDPIQATGAVNLQVLSNTFQGPTCTCDSANRKASHFLIEAGGQSGTVYMTGNWINGFNGGAAVIDGSSSMTTVLEGNIFGTYYPTGNAICSGSINIVGSTNTWQCDGSPITSCSQGKPGCAVPYPGTCPGTSIY